MFVIFECLKLVEFKLLREVINGSLEYALRVSDSSSYAFRKQSEVLLWQHEHKSKNGVIWLISFELNIDFMMGDVVIDIAQKRSVVIMIIPTPRR